MLNTTYRYSLDLTISFREGNKTRIGYLLHRLQMWGVISQNTFTEVNLVLELLSQL
jgi:hypothetical protein